MYIPKKITGLVLLLALLFCLSGCAHQRLPDPIILPSHPPAATPVSPVKVALVLSGGGARGIAHAGVIDVLEKHHIPIDLIVGSSAGSLIGALYADEPNSRALYRKVISLHKWDLLDLSWSSGIKMLWELRGPVEGNALRCFLQDHLSATDFKQLRIPLAVVTTDINRGEAFTIRSGPIIPALHASSAVPMLFSPVQLYGKTLVDGGVASPVPVEIAKQFHPQLIIAVDIGTSPNYGPVHNTYDLAMRSLHISYFKLAQWQTTQADVVIHPPIDAFGMFDDHANAQLYLAGQKAATRMIPRIRQLLAARHIQPFTSEK